MINLYDCFRNLYIEQNETGTSEVSNVPITIEELEKVIKNGITRGIDNILNEHIKNSIPFMLKCLILYLAMELFPNTVLWC